MAVRSLGLWAGAVALMCASSAQAYCRTHTLDPAASSCPESCPELGLPLAWPTPHLEYAFNDQGFAGIAGADLRRIIATSIGTWENVRCDGKSVGIDSVAAAAPTSLTIGPKEDEPNDNAIVYFTEEEWDEQSLSSNAYAITAVWFDSKNGRILGGDMLFNGGKGPFGECPDTGCRPTDPPADLRNVATHEFGHFFGLSHSAVRDSSMWCDAQSQEITKRSLSADDIEGMCDLYPPEIAFREYKGKGGMKSCSLASNAEGDPPWAVLAVPLWLLWRRRRSSARLAARALRRG